MRALLSRSSSEPRDVRWSSLARALASPLAFRILTPRPEIRPPILSPDALFGTVMLANVWGVIWRNQKVVIASAVAAASGGQANPAAAAAGRRAFLASRTNVVFSIPMLFFMGAATHWPPTRITHPTEYWV